MIGKAAYSRELSGTRHRRTHAFSYALARSALILVLIFSALVAAGGAFLLLYGWNHNETAFQGVTIAGAGVGGLNQQQAASRITNRIDSIAPKQIVLSFQGQTWQVSASELGIHYDANATAAQALQVGHSGNLWVRSHDWLTTLASGESVPVAFRLDSRSAFNALQALAPSVTRPAQDAGYVFKSDGSLAIVPGKPGVAIDVAATVDALRNNVARLSSQPIAIETQSVPPAISAKSLEPTLKQVESMVSQPFVLTDHGTKWAISPDTLRKMLVIQPNPSGPASVSISTNVLETYLAQIAGQVRTNGVNASVQLKNGTFAVVPSVDGESLDAHATTANVIQALEGGTHQIAVAVTDSPAPIVDADAQNAIERAQQILAQPLKLTWTGGSQDLTSEQLASALTFTNQPDQNPKIAIGVNNDTVTKLVQSLSSKVDVPAKDANLRYLNGKVTVVSPEQNGASLDVTASATAVESAVSSGANTVALATVPVKPNVTAAMAGTISLPDKLSSGATYYGGSVANRAFNVELAVKRVNGALIPPGATFSFNNTVGAVDTAHGYKLGYGIVATAGGGASTVPSVGGGICQVATTLFHAAFWAGLPIVQRTWHLYWIPLYGQPPSGLTGLDATIDTDAGLDLKFKNTTDNWIGVKASADGTWVRFELWGTDPGWTVNVSKPVVTNVVKADTTMHYEKSNLLPAGTTVFVEEARDGFDVSIHRQVLDKSGKLIDDLILKSHYVPATNITLQGTG